MRRVLVIDDDPREVAVTRNAVLRAGLFPDCVATAQEAIFHLLKATYSYVVLEPALRGLDLSLIVSLANKQNAAIVVTTEDSSLASERRLRETGVLYYMVKPVSDPDLCMILRNTTTNGLQPAGSTVKAREE